MEYDIDITNMQNASEMVIINNSQSSYPDKASEGLFQDNRNDDKW